MMICSWTKILTKSTDRYRAVVDRLAQTEIPRLSVKFGPLREQIVHAKLAELRTIQYSAPPLTEAIFQQPFAALQGPELTPWAGLPVQLECVHGTMRYLQSGS